MNRITTVFQAIFIALILSSAVSAQVAGRVQSDKFKKEAAVVQLAIDETVNDTIPGYGLIERTKCAYVEGYGAVLTLEVAFEQSRNPFNSSKTPAEIRTLVGQRQKQLRERLSALVQQKTIPFTSLLPEESMAIIVYVLNSNPADVPDLPASIVISVKKQDVLDQQAGKITAAELSGKVSIR